MKLKILKLDHELAGQTAIYRPVTNPRHSHTTRKRNTYAAVKEKAGNSVPHTNLNMQTGFE